MVLKKSQLVIIAPEFGDFFDYAFQSVPFYLNSSPIGRNTHNYIRINNNTLKFHGKS